MKILHIASGLDPRSGGPTRSISGLCRGLAQAGVETTLFVHSPAYELAKPGNVRFAKGRGSGLLTAWQDANRIMDEVQPDLIHLHGIWTLTNAVDAAVARKRQIPYVIAPRGMLEPWSLNAKRWKKRIALFLYQRRDLKRAVALHATAAAEAAQLRKLGFEQPIIVSPNGVDIPAVMPPRSQRPNKKKTMLFLSRIHPKKGLTELVEGWASLKKQKAHGNQPGATDTCLTSVACEWGKWHFEYAGPDSGSYLAVVQKRIQDLGLEDDFTYLGNLNDKEKWTAYRRADLFVLPTYSENFGIVVAEALAAGVPVITTKGTPWSELMGTGDQLSVIGDRLSVAAGGRCGWWIDIGVEPLVEALREAVGLSEAERRALGENGRRLVEAGYTWPAITQQMKQAYEWVLNGGKRLDGVQIS